MVDQHHAKQAFLFHARKNRGERRKLPLADPACRAERRGGDAAVQADQRERSAPAHEREAFAGVAAHERAPLLQRARHARAHVDVVIAGHGADTLGRVEALQPRAANCKFFRQRDVGNVAGDGDVVWILFVQVCGKRVERGAGMDQVPPAPPIYVAGHALADQLVRPRRRQWREMDVGEVGEGEH